MNYPKNNKAKSFPEILMEILSLGDTDYTVHDIVTWLPDGKSFVVFDPAALSGLVLPRYFPRAQYSSFTRRLNRWGFRQVAKGAARGAFHHALFQRDMPHLCKHMTCNKKQQANISDAIARLESEAEVASNAAVAVDSPVAESQAKMCISDPLMWNISNMAPRKSFTNAETVKALETQKLSKQNKELEDFLCYQRMNLASLFHQKHNSGENHASMSKIAALGNISGNSWMTSALRQSMHPSPIILTNLEQKKSNPKPTTLMGNQENISDQLMAVLSSVQARTNLERSMQKASFCQLTSGAAIQAGNTISSHPDMSPFAGATA